MNRNPDGLKTWVVKADGTWHLSQDIFYWANDTWVGGKNVQVHLQGGAMIVNGAIWNNFTDGPSANYVTFDAAGSKFTAKFGGQLPNPDSVQAATGPGKNFRPIDNTVTLTAVDNMDGTFTITAAAVVQELPTASFTVSPGRTGRAGVTAFGFTDTSTGVPTSWSWDFGGDGTSALQNPKHTFASPGTYTVSLIASNAFGSSSAYTMNITVIPATAGIVYTWTGGAGAGSYWENPGNWDTNGVPSNGSGSLATPYATDTVIFNSETAVGNHMPGASIGVGRAPNLTLANGTLNLAYYGQNWSWSGTTFTIGDGNMTTLAQANTDLSNLNRDPDGVKTYVIKADGALSLSGGIYAWADNTDWWGKTAVVHLQGGQMIVNGSINANFTDGASVNYVTFDAPGSKFTAKFGGQLPNLAAVQAAIGTNLNFRAGTGLTRMRWTMGMARLP